MRQLTPSQTPSIISYIIMRPKCPIHKTFLPKSGTCNKCVSLTSNSIKNLTSSSYEPVATRLRKRKPRIYGDVALPSRRDLFTDTFHDTCNDDDTISTCEDSDCITCNEISDTENNNLALCTNCHRIQDSSYTIRVLTSSCNLTHRLNCLKKDNLPPEVTLCVECRRFLQDEDLSWKSTWPSFLWKMFKNPKNDTKASKMWKFIPSTWRKWWIQEFQTISDSHKIVTFSSPSPYFVDVTSERQLFNDLLNSNTYAGLIEAYNKFPHCRVRCPWGEDEFLEQCGHIPLDVTLRHFLHIQAPLVNKSYNHRIQGGNSVFVGIREDYFTFKFNFLGREDWDISPCIQVIPDIGPCILTCSDHDGGSKYQYIHPPHNPVNFNLPARHSDQLAHCVVAPRTIKTMKPHKYSDSYQLSKCQGGYKGMDTMDLVEKGKFDFMSTISSNNECLSISQRPDIKAKLWQLVQSREIPRHLAEDKIEYAQHFMKHNQTDCNQALHGSTYVSVDDCLDLRQSMEASNYAKEEVTDETNGHTTTHNFTPKWPFTFAHCHTDTNFGCKPPPIPIIQYPEDCRILWFLTSMATSIKHLWKNIASSVKSEKEWFGWLLSYATTKSLRYTPNRNQKLYRDKLTIFDIMLKLHPDFREENFNIFFFGEIMNSIVNTQTVFGLIDPQLSDIHDSTTIIVLLRDDEDERGHPQKIIHLEDTQDTFKLCYAAYSTGDFAHRGKWQARAFFQHYNLPPTNRFWKLERGKEPFKCNDPDLDFCDILVYVKVHDSDSINLKRDYLQYMGGQVDATCPKHQYPLTLCAVRTAPKCNFINDDQTQCSNNSSFQCPLRGCTKAVCKKHVTTFKCTTDSLTNSGASTKKREHAFSFQETFRKAHKNATNKHIRSRCLFTRTSSSLSDTSETDSESSLSDDDSQDSFWATKTNNPHRHTHTQHDYDKWIGDHDNSDSDSSTDDPLIFPIGPTSYETESESSDESETETDKVVPSTNAYEVPIQVTAKNERIGLHVLLNQHGSLLVRRERQMRGSNREQGFLQRIVATSPHHSVPLIYPEASIFPSIFWHSHSDGSITGAIPVCLWNSDTLVRKHGFATIQNHMKNRLKNSSLLCSTDHRYIFFAFDSMNNIMSRGTDTRLVLRRGFEHMVGSGGVKEKDSFSNGTMKPDINESMRNLFMLEAMVADKEPTYFVTHTCNQTKHFGVAPIKNHLDCIIEEIQKDTSLSEAQCDEKCLATRQSASVQIIRSWLRVATAYMNYILTSPEQPLGPIRLYTWKFEDQDDEGNLPHIHALLQTKEDKQNPDQQAIISDRIRCSVRTIVRPDEIQDYIAQGLIQNYNEAEDVRDDAKVNQQHFHRSRRCCRLTGTGDEEIVCRVTNHALENPNPMSYGYKDINVVHLDEVMQLLQKMKLATLDNATGETTFLHPKLKAGMYVYPADNKEHFVPTTSKLYVGHRSQSNTLQNDGYLTARYIAKYMNELDKNQRVQVKAGKEENTFILDHEEIPNTKISSNNYFQKQIDKKHKRDPTFMGRKLGLPEAVRLILNYPSYYTNANYVFVPTVPLEDRPGIECGPKRRDLIQRNDHRTGHDIGHGGILEGVRVRDLLQLPLTRRFTNSQVTIMTDALTSPLTPDAITAFSCRPPELRFVDNPTDYIVCFSRQRYKHPKKVKVNGEDTFISTQEALLHSDIMHCGWVDGLDSQILVRPQAIGKILSMKGCQGPIRKLFLLLNDIYQADSTTAASTNNNCSHSTISSDSSMTWSDASSWIVNSSKMDDETENTSSSTIDTLPTVSIKPLEEGRFNNFSCFQFNHPPQQLHNLTRMLSSVSSLTESTSENENNQESEVDESSNSIVPSQSDVSSQENETMRTRFFDLKYNSSYLPLPIYNCVKPTKTTRFLVHILLSMGKFSNEMELFHGKTFKDYFINAQLLPKSNKIFPVSEKDVMQIAKDYTMKQLVYIPGGTKSFDRNCLLAYDVLYSALVNDEVITGDTPSFLYTSLTFSANEKARKYRAELQATTAAVCSLITGVPSKQALLYATKFNPTTWTYTQQRLPDQTKASFEEKCHATKVMIHAVNEYMTQSRKSTKSYMILGGPGTGKTYQIQIGVAYSLSRGLTGTFTALTAERALSLGGIHLHALFGINVINTTRINPNHLAQNAIVRLYKHPEKVTYIRKLDFLAIDEMGLIPAELISTIDMICRYTRGKSAFMGGILVLATIDHLQLGTINGIPPLISPQIITNFEMIKLIHMMRSLSDR